MLLEGKNKSIGGRPTMKASKVLGWKTKIIKAASQGSKLNRHSNDSNNESNNTNNSFF